MKAPPPLPGYNTNVRHKGRLYHIQTEDSGLSSPNIITHLFADGGRVIASRKTNYADYTKSENWSDRVKELMKEQHRAMFTELRDGVHDGLLDDSAPAPPQEERASRDFVPDTGLHKTLDAEALEDAAARISVQSSTHELGPVTKETQIPKTQARSKSKVPEPDDVSAKSLDEVILSFLTRELDPIDKAK